MKKRKLDLSHTLCALEGELSETLQDLLIEPTKEYPIFSDTIDAFVEKYGTSGFQSLDELLEASQAEASNLTREMPAFSNALIKSLTS